MMIFKNIFFYFLFYFWTTLFFVFFSPVNFFTRRFTVYLSVVWSKSIINLAKIILGIDYVIEGENNIPKSGPFLVASNHQSAWETFFIYSYFYDSVFILKKELKKIPIISRYFKKLGFIFIDRNKGFDSLKHMIESIKSLICEGNKIFLIFPQGTRVKPGDKIKLNPGVFAIHKISGIPILPIRHNSGQFWINKGFLKKRGLIKVRIFPVLKNGKKKDEVLGNLERIYY